MRTRTEFSQADDKHLIAYIAVNNPGKENRTRAILYKQLVEDANGEWEWAQRHPWSGWLERYRKDQEYFDLRIEKYQDKHKIVRPPSPPPKPASSAKKPPSSATKSPSSATKRSRHPFTKDEDKELVRFLARIAPLKERDKRRAKLGRRGNYVYEEILVRDLDLYPWASEHSWHSWRERYVKRQDSFDARIERWQKKHGLDPIVRAKELDRIYAKKAGTSEVIPEVKQEVKQEDDEESGLSQNTNHSTVERSGKRLRSRRNGEEEADDTDDGARPRKRQKRSGALPTSDAQSRSSSEEVVEMEPLRTQSLARSRSRSPDEIGEEDNEQVDQLAGDTEEVVQRGDRVDEVQEDKHIEEPQGVEISSPPDQTPTQASPPFVALNLNWAPFEEPVSAASDEGPLYPRLPTPPLPLSGFPNRIPGDYPESPQTRKTLRHAPPEPSSVARSHPPTPPATNIQSDASIQSLSLASDTPRPSAKAKGKERAIPSTSPTASQSLQRYRSGSSTEVAAQRPIPNPSTRNPTVEDTLDTRRPPFIPSSPYSDGPFATSPPEPRHTEVIHGVPKPRPGRSFRDHDRVRGRNVIRGEGDRAGAIEQESNDEDEDDEERGRDLWPPTREKSKGRASEPRRLVQVQSDNAASTSGAIITQTTGNTITSRPSNKQANHHLREHVVSSIDLSPKAPNNTPLPTPPSMRHIVVHKTPAIKSLETSDTDVFASQTPIASGSRQEPYVLGASHLPKPSTASTLSRVRPSSPVPQRRMPRDRDRRSTFGGFGLRSSLPDIDLLTRLKGKRTSSRSPALTWTRGSPDIQIPPNPPPRASSPNLLLSGLERTAARRGPSRNSVIPVILDSEDQGGLPLSLNQLSPSTSGLIMQAGLAAIFQRMEENHGFSADVVRRTWIQQNMDLNATDKKLLRMRIAAENASHSDSDEAVPTRPAQGRDAERMRSRVENTPAMRHPTSWSDTHDSPTDYTPPLRSRAAQYLNLSEQGRIWEARQREVELASRISESTSSSPVKGDPPKVLVPSVWGDEDDEALRRADEATLAALAEKFGEDVVRKKFLTNMQ